MYVRYLAFSGKGQNIGRPDVQIMHYESPKKVVGPDVQVAHIESL